jgi:hypothetical protein
MMERKRLLCEPE